MHFKLSKHFLATCVPINNKIPKQNGPTKFPLFPELQPISLFENVSPPVFDLHHTMRTSTTCLF